MYLFKFRTLLTAYLKCNMPQNFQVRQSVSKIRVKNDLNKLRNIGIIAHIDAGKTTTTERMLFYSGLTNLMGEVHDGNTVMDYMHLERERGITITSAAITFKWKNHTINLIDTPGHVDFTFEVERALAVLDGAITILDSSAGVEVQTLKVWNQADKYGLPCIVYLNKMDKPAADTDLCLISLIKKLKIKPLMLHVPIGMGKHFKGVIDLVKMEKVLWKNTENSDGRMFEIKSVTLESDKELYHSAVVERDKLIELIADLDDVVAEKYINEGANALVISDIQSALRRITIKRLAVPVLCGSSYKNVGVQLLMDAIVHYLPTPNERTFSFNTGNDDDDLCAYVFKIIHDKQKDPLTFMRIFTGSIRSNQKLYNINREGSEKVGKIKIAYANDFKEVSSIYAGNIAVVTGLKDIITGDILFSSTSALERKKSQLEANKINNAKFFIEVPNPVFFCTIEPPSVGFQNQLDFALRCLQREDPTLCIEVDESLGQTILMGMGELHIEIIKERIKLEYGVDAYLGPLQVAYRETLELNISHNHVLEKTVGGNKQYVNITIRLYPSQRSESSNEINIIVTKENGLGKLRLDYLKAINSGLRNAFSNGPLLSFPVINVEADLLWFEAGKSTSNSMISAATSQCVLAALKKSKICLLEPVMKLCIILEKGYAGRVLNDLSQKRSHILNMESRQEVEIIESKTPLSELRGFSTNLRAITSGRCSFTMEFDSYEKLDYQEQVKAIQDVTGFVPS